MTELLQTRLTSTEPLYSSHIFLYPFEWSYRQPPSDLLEDQTELLAIEKIMAANGARWERRSGYLPPQTLTQFNEVVYFYEFVRPVLYDTGHPDSLQRHYFFRPPGPDFTYVITLATGTTYRLAIDDIVLSFYDTGVGVMAFHLLNQDRQQSSPQDILNINFFGRRVYPPFFSTELGNIGEQAFFEDQDWTRGLGNTQQFNNLAQSISLQVGTVPLVMEDFQRWIIDQHPEREPELVAGLFPVALQQALALAPVLDDRMFTVSWYGNAELVKYLKGTDPEEDYQTNDWWYQYIFVDRDGSTCPNRAMCKKLLTEATYPRWISEKYSTYYGISRYSFVALTEEMTKNYFARLINSHVRSMYYKIALLGLVQRSSLLRFSQEVTAISQLPRRDRRIAQRVGSLFKQYLRFVNKIYFREVTAQEQGIELYAILQEQMRLDKQVKDLELEIQELHHYVTMLEEDQRNNKLDVLTYIGALFVAPSFIGTYFGINGYQMAKHWLHISIFSFAAALLALLVVYSQGRYRIIWLSLLILLMLCLLFYYPSSQLEIFKS